MKNSATIVRLAEIGCEYRRWYQDANRELIAAAADLAIAPRRLADLLALFSPRVSVKRSIDNAIRYAKDGGFNPGVIFGIKAAVVHYEATGQIRGVKTKPFADAIYGDLDAIALDVWMAVALGIEQEQLSRKPVHKQASDTIRRSADIVGWRPAECQAAVWAATVLAAGRTPARLKIVNRLHVQRNRTLWEE